MSANDDNTYNASAAHPFLAVDGVAIAIAVPAVDGPFLLFRLFFRNCFATASTTIIVSSSSSLLLGWISTSICSSSFDESCSTEGAAKSSTGRRR